MNNKGTYIYDGNVQDVFLTASNILNDAVFHTLGSNGTNTAIPTSNNFLSIINDGKTILESLSDSDPAIKLALNTLKESAFATNQNAGDGTTSTTVIQNALLSNIINHNRKTNITEELITSSFIKQIRDEILTEALPKLKKDLNGSDDLRKVINVSLGSDELTDIVMDAFKDLPLNQKPSLIKNQHIDKTEVLSIDGVSLTPVEVNPVVLRSFPSTSEEPLNIIILNQQVSRIDTGITKMLNFMAKSPYKTILLYTDVMPSVMDQILFNIQEGALNVIPIKLSYAIDKVNDYVNELSRYFSLTPINDLNPYQSINAFDSTVVGQATGYILNKDSIIIKNSNSEYTSELLPSKSSVISVGFTTYSQQEEDYRRLEDAIHSSYNALLYGYTIGGGFTLLTLPMIIPSFNPDDIRYEVITKSLSVIFNKISKDSNADLPNEKFINQLEQNIFDSYKVTEQVILNSFTVVSQVLSTEKILIPYK